MTKDLLSVTKRCGRPPKNGVRAQTGAERQRAYMAKLRAKPHRKRKPESDLDLWETPPVALETLLEQEELHGSVLEPCSGHGSLVRVLRAWGTVCAGDVVERDFPLDYVRDFLELTADVHWS